MKILHVEAGKHLYGGARQVQYITEGLAARGIDSLLACPIDSEMSRQPPVGVRVLPIRMGGDGDIGLAFRLARLIRAEQPDLVHLHSRRGADTWGGLAAKMAGVPCVLSRRVDNPESRLAVAIKYRLYDHVITISEAIRQVLLDEGLAADKVSCVRSAVDPAPFLAPVDPSAFRAEFRLPQDALVIGVVAQMIPRKGHRYLFSALPGLLERYPELQVLVFGQGPLLGELRGDVAARGLDGVVHFTGFRHDLASWIGGLDMLVHPAEMEGLGVSLLQAAAAGVPVITSRAGGLPEAVQDGVTGILCPPGDVDALAAAIDHLAGDPALRHQYGKAGRQRILAEFSIGRMVDGNLALYHQVLGR
ncbi:glycosyltransferase [Zoogloea sp.]|uniref:glycosyltransferase n=1 Tax=Zoogloea sp. TaxID=49181 RepID=UPI001D2ED1C0|nr:glycosyltransferase [Zoogloea sp.]MBK6655463.1 glycosyltransferase [Zoogloea sp.]